MKQQIMENLDKRGNVLRSFLKHNNLTQKECYDIVSSEKKKCKCCNIESTFISFSNGYKETCNNKECINKNSKIKRDITLMEKYGTTDTFLINDGRKRGLEKCNNDVYIKEKRKQTCIEKYGVDNTFKSMDIQEKIKDIIEEKYGVRNISYLQETKDKISEINTAICTSEEMIWRRNKLDENGITYIEKQKNTNIESGKWLSDSEKSDYWLYSRDVWKYTNKQDLQSLVDYDKRGHINDNPDAFHLDHRYSIFEGFNNKINAEIIGSIYNLEMIHNKINSKKREKSSISKEELLGLFYANK